MNFNEWNFDGLITKFTEPNELHRSGYVTLKNKDDEVDFEVNKTLWNQHFFNIKENDYVNLSGVFKTRIKETSGGNYKRNVFRVSTDVIEYIPA